MGDHVALTFAVTGMHCSSCGLLIDDTVEELDGVAGSQTDSRRGRTVVRGDPGMVSVESIVAAIADAGYQAELATG